MPARHCPFVMPFRRFDQKNFTLTVFNDCGASNLYTSWKLLFIVDCHRYVTYYDWWNYTTLLEHFLNGTDRLRLVRLRSPQVVPAECSGAAAPQLSRFARSTG